MKPDEPPAMDPDERRLRDIGREIINLMSKLKAHPAEQAEVLINILLTIHDAFGKFYSAEAQEDLERAMAETLVTMREQRGAQ